MKAAELREKGVDDLEKELSELRREQFKLRMQNGTGQLGNVSELRRVRRDIARVLTVMREQRKQAGN